MESNYIHTHHSAQKSKLMAQKLNESPQDKHKAMYGETNQANYLINAKDRNSENKCRRELFNDRTNAQAPTATNFEGPISPFRDQSSKMSSIRNDYGPGGAPHSPVKSFDYRV